jgi:chromosomal replication initiation ATPase DnaA
LGLPQPQNNNEFNAVTDDYHNEHEIINKAAPQDTSTRIEELLRGLNNQQSVIVSDALESLQAETGKCFYMDGPGGTGKTHVYQILTELADLKNILTVNVASTGIAATLLPKGSTAHSCFKSHCILPQPRYVAFQPSLEKPPFLNQSS